MYLKRIILNNFKNIRETCLEFSPRLNCISGNNGAGKTNLLDAVYYLSMTKSFFSVSDRYVYTHGAQDASLNGSYVMDDGSLEKIAIAVRREGTKIVKRNDKSYSKFSEHIGLLPIVMVSPADSSLINDAGEERRKAMNFILAQIDRNYLPNIQKFNQLLLARNKYLKSDNIPQDLINAITEQMTAPATYVYSARRQLCIDLLPIVREYYSIISGGTEDVSMEYKSDLQAASMEELMLGSQSRDTLFRYTTVGPQRDDLLFLLDGHPIRKCGSQGQQKSFLLAVKLAQFALMKRLYGVSPILLLDDVFDKLDINRVKYLLKIVSSDEFGQIFVTDSNKIRLSSLTDAFSADWSAFYVENGEFIKEDN